MIGHVSTRSCLRPRSLGIELGRVLPNKALQRASNSSVQLDSVGVWRHTFGAGSGPVSAVAGR